MKRSQSVFEKIFEWLLWKSRFIVILAVIFGILGAISLFALASYNIIMVSLDTLKFFSGKLISDNFSYILIGKTIGAVDLYLIAIVMIIFSFGVYELFISQIEDAEKSETGSKILSIHSLDELKDKLGKVVVMVLIVSFFKRVMHMEFHSPLSMLFLALSILALAISLYLMHKSRNQGKLL